MLGLALAAFGLGTGIQAWGQHEQGQFTKKMFEYNRALSLRYARAIREIRAWEAAKFFGQVAGVFPKQKVITAAAGLEVSGTPLKVMKATRQKLYEQGEIMRLEKEMEISRIASGADISRMRGQLAEISGRYGAWGSLLTGAGTLGLTAYQYS